MLQRCEHTYRVVKFHVTKEIGRLRAVNLYYTPVVNLPACEIWQWVARIRSVMARARNAVVSQHLHSACRSRRHGYRSSDRVWVSRSCGCYGGVFLEINCIAYTSVCIRDIIHRGISILTSLPGRTIAFHTSGTSRTGASLFIERQERREGKEVQRDENLCRN